MGHQHGLKAWKELKDEFEPQSGNRAAAVLKAVLKPQNTWQMELASGIEHAAENLREVLRAAHESVKATYVGLKTHLREYQVSGRSYRFSTDAQGVVPGGHGDPMEVDAVLVKGGKGKGKQKGKAKGKGKAKTKTKEDGSTGGASSSAQVFQGERGFCGKWGRKRADCRKRLAQQHQHQPGKASSGGGTVAVVTEEVSDK